MITEFIQKSRLGMCLVPCRQTYCHRYPTLWEKSDQWYKLSVAWRPNNQVQVGQPSVFLNSRLMVATVPSHNARVPKLELMGPAAKARKACIRDPVNSDG